MKRFYKLRHGKMIMGVCGGLAEYLQIDPSIVRLIWLFLAFTVAGIVVYFAMGIILPYKDEITY